jgi:GT2 family glycosyltransferase
VAQVFGGDRAVKAEVTQLSVVIPTYHRETALINCVQSILQGSELPSEILIVGREGDKETESALDRLRKGFQSEVSIRPAWVKIRGHLPPIEMGLRLAANDLIAFVDDDVTVSEDWLRTLLPNFADPSVGVVGGRVVVPGATVPKLKGKPGLVSWYGKQWGNIASVEGENPIFVDGVMECNWIWRSSLLRSITFEALLNFDDASMYGLDLCLQAQQKGFRVLYDPRVLVHHHLAPRTRELDRADRHDRTFTYCRNITYIMLKRLPWWRKPIFLAWWVVVGERGGWGIGALVADILLRGVRNDRHVVSSMRGKIEGARLWFKA